MTSHSYGNVLAAFLGLAAVLAAASGCRHEAAAAPAPPALELNVVKPLLSPVVDDVQYTARLAAVESVDIRARVNGYLVKVDFEAGAEVPVGKVLFRIDPRPYQASLDAAKARVEIGKSHLQQLDAEVARSKRLPPSGAISREDFEKTMAQWAETAASIDAAKAEEEKAQLDLDFTEVKAPIAGVVSREQITAGNLVTADQTLLTNIVRQDPVYAYFNVDELTVQKVLKGANDNAANPQHEQVTAAYLRLGTETGFPHVGRIDFVDNRVDPSTGTMQVRAVFPNPKPEAQGGKRSLVPGFFGRVRIPLTSPYQAMMIPEAALMTDQGRKYVFVVDPHDAVQRRDVQTGKLDAGNRVILEGLAADDRVLVEGTQLVRPGMTVKPKVVDAMK